MNGDIQTILTNNGTNLVPNSTGQITAGTGTIESMDLDAIVKKAYEDEMAKHQAEIAAAQAQYQEAQAALERAQATMANLSNGNVQTAVYNQNQIASIQQIAVAEVANQQKMVANPIVSISAGAGAVEPASYASGGFVMPTGAEKETVYKIIAAEGGGVSPQEAVNIASTMINRARTGGWSGGNDIYKIATARGQYVAYENGAYKKSALTPEARAAVDQLFASTSMGGATAHQYSSFRSKTSPKGVQLVDGGNKYR